MRHYLKSCILLFAFSITPLIHSQNVIKDSPGIPVLTYYWWGFNDLSWQYPVIIDTMKTAGVGFLYQDMDSYKIDTLRDLWGMKIIPTSSYSDSHSDTVNWIEYYTDAKYTVWKTAGITGDTSYLQHKSTMMDEVTSGSDTYIKLKDTAAKYRDTLIRGPYYYQGLHYYTGNKDTVIYQAEFRMKLENYIPYQEITSFTDNPFDTTALCIIQVTHSIQDPHSFNLVSTIIDAQDTIRRNRFPSLLYDFKIIPLIYQFSDNPNSSVSYNSVYHCYGTKDVITLEGREYVQFKVIWLGNPNYLLSIDNITVSDNRGRDLKNHSLQAFTLITDQVNSLSSCSPGFVGSWLGIDEPNSYDNYEPIRIVDSLVYATQTTNKAKVLYSFMGHWDGAFENRNNPWGTYRLSPWVEMAKHVETDKINICQDFYYFDWPYQSYYETDGGKTPCNCIDYRAKNIDIVGELNYKQAYNLNHNFGVSLQCGCINNSEAIERNNTGRELLYSANLASLFGAKFLSLYTFVAEKATSDQGSGGTNHGIIDFDIDHNFTYTDKLKMFCDTLGPRLKGLFGQTIKKLIPTYQHIGTHGFNFHDALPYHPYIVTDPGDINTGCINYCNQVEENSTHSYYIDYGYFTDSTNESTRKYFMVLNRYYSEFIHHEIGLKTLAGFTNWKLMCYSDTVSKTLQAVDGEAQFIDTIYIGDAGLYSVMPVVKYGGEINFDETISGTNTLTGEMSIGADATLTISGVYDIYNKITVNGTLVVDSGATLNFHNGASLDIKGNIQANKAIFNFSPNAAGNIGLIWFNLHSSGSIFNSNTVNNCGNILLQPWSNTTIENCNINNSINGISVYACTAQIINNTIYHPAHFGIYDYDNSQDVFITGNKIYHDSTQGKDNPNSIGIYIDNIYYNSWIANNDVQGFNCGIFTVEWSYLTFANPNTDVSNPNNRFMHNHIGIRATDCSHIFAGDPNDPGGYQDLPCQFNTISDNDIPVILTDNSTLFATNNYWGPDVSCDNPPPGDFCWDYCTGECGIGVGINDNSGTFQFGPDFLTEDPWAPPETGGPTKTRTKPVNKYHSSKSLADNEAGNKTSTAKLTRSLVDVDAKDNLMTAMALEKNGMLNEANNIYENMISKGNNVRAALSCLVHQKNKLSKEDISNRLRILLKKNPNNSSAINNMLGRLSLFNNKFDDAMILFNNVMMNDPKGYDGISARFAKLFAYINIRNDNTKAMELLSEIKSMNLADNESKTKISMAEDLLGLSKNNNQGNNIVKLAGMSIIPKSYELFQNYPNPFNPETTIRYQIPKPGLVTLKVYDILGREITTLVNENKIEGSYDFTFNASRFPSGVYIYQLRVNDYVSSKKMILLK